MTKPEIDAFLTHLISVIKRDGLDAGYQTAAQKIQAYPTCHWLILQTALTLTGSSILCPQEHTSNYEAEIEQLFLRALESTDPDIFLLANTMLTSMCIKRNEFDKAQAFLDQMPNTKKCSKQKLQANLYLQQEDYEKAARLIEHELLSSVTDLTSYLILLMDTAIKENRIQDAEALANISCSFAHLFSLWDYNAYTAHFQLYFSQQNAEQLIATLDGMLTAAASPWKISDSPLYRHIGNAKKVTTVGTEILKNIISSIEKNENNEFDFLIKHSGYKAAIARWKKF